MSERTIRLCHRIAVDWVADTFGLRGQGSAQARHERARDQAHVMARRLPDRLHRAHPPRVPRVPRVLKSWQARIGQLAAVNRSQS
jgi:hypothetical protein